MLCQTPPPQETCEDLVGPDYYEGEMTVRLNLKIVKRFDGSGGWTYDDINEFIEQSKSIFGVHGMKFNICVDEVLNDEYYVNKNYHTVLHNEGSYVDGNTIIGVLYGNGYGSGFAPAAPGKLFHCDGIYILTAIHELGHCLGLVHTFEDSATECSPFEDDDGNIIYGENASFSGDCIEDTPADRTYHDDDIYFDAYLLYPTYELVSKYNNPMGKEDPCGNEYIDPEGYLLHNIMTYYNGLCRNLITPGQAEWIRNQITKIPDVIDENGYQEKPLYNMDIYITDNETWNYYDMIINGDIYVLNGNFKIQNSDLEFTDGHKLVVRSSNIGGPAVDILSSTLDVNQYSSCTQQSSKWGGIEIDLTTSNSNTYASPWILIDENSHINNAVKAVSNVSFDPSKKFVLMIYDSFFENNDMALDIQNSSSIVWLKNSEFLFDGDYVNANSAHLRFVNSFGPWLDNVQVKNFNNSVLCLINGIDIFESNLRVTGDSYVENWTKGVNSYNSAGKVLTIRNSNFISNVNHGIYNYGNNYSVLLNDNIFNSSYSNCPSSTFNGHVFLEDVDDTDIKISNNQFVGTQSGITSLLNTSDDHNLIYHNFFSEESFYGVRWINEYDEEDKSNTKFLCNELNNIEGFSPTFHIVALGNISSMQANVNNDNIIASAGNKYAQISGTNFGADAGYGIYYKYKLPIEDPVNYYGITKQYIQEESTCPENGFGDVEDVIGDGNTGDDYVKYTDTKTKIDSIQDVIDTNTDNGNTVLVINVIGGVTIPTAVNVTQYLISLGPWLSEEAAEVLIDNADVFTEEQLLSIIIANPDLLMDYNVYQFALGENSVFSDAGQNVLRNASGVITDKTRLVTLREHHNMKLTYIINRAIEKVVFNTNKDIDFDNLRTWFERNDKFKSRFDIADSYMTQGDFRGSVLYLRSLIKKGDISIEQQNDIENYIVINNLLGSVLEDNRTWDQMTPVEKIQLNQIANSTESKMSQKKARGILKYFYGYTFVDDKIKIRNEQYINPRDNESDISNKINVYPNPSKGEFVIGFVNNSEEIGVRKITVLSLTGETIFERKYDDMIQNARIKLEHNVPGLYIYKVLDDNGEEYTGKLMLD